MLRQQNPGNHTFVSVVEPHGLYDVSREITVGNTSQLKSIRKLIDNETLTVVELQLKDGNKLLYAVLNDSSAPATNRLFLYNGLSFNLSGNYLLQLISQKK